MIGAGVNTLGISCILVTWITHHTRTQDRNIQSVDTFKHMNSTSGLDACGRRHYCSLLVSEMYLELVSTVLIRQLPRLTTLRMICLGFNDKRDMALSDVSTEYVEVYIQA